MAKLSKKPDRRRARRSEPDAIEIPRYRTSWRSAFLTAALAALAGAVVFVWLFNPLSMLGAATRAEYAALGRHSDRKTGRTPSEVFGWTDVIAAANVEYRASAKRGSQATIARLLYMLKDVHLGYRSAKDALPEAQSEAELDGDNLLARWVHAVLLDLSNGSASPGGAGPQTAISRYEAVRAVIAGDAPAETASLYNRDLTSVWYEVLKRFIKRPQVAASLAVSFPHDRTEIHYEVLSIIQDYIAGLAGELREAGQPEKAEHCVRWFTQLSLGLMKAEHDAGTRLLCADLLARSLADRPALAEPLARMRSDFHAAATAAPIDLCEQAFSQMPTVAPPQYRRAFYSLVLIGVLAVTGAGGATVFVVSCLGACLTRVFYRGKPPSGGEFKRRRIVRIIAGLSPPLALGGVLVGWFETYGVYSELWAYVVAACLLAGGAAWTIVSAGWATERQRKDLRTRQWITVALSLLVVLSVLLPPSAVAYAAREVELRVGIGWVLLPWLCVLVIAAMWCSPARWRTLAAAGAMGWLVNLAAALAILPLHQVADSRYQTAVLAGRFDEIAARLGADWEEKYLKPVKEAFVLDAS